VARVDPDLPVHTLLDRSVPQVGGDRVRDILHGTGRGVRVGIIDTGVDYHHPALGGAFGPGARVAGGEDFVNHDNDPMDDHGHGTHVAGIVAGNGGGVVGMATEATLYAYKVLNEYGGGFTSDVIAGLERCADPDHDPATDDRLDVVNMSLGAFGGDPDDAISHAVDALDALGTTVVVAAGNAGGLFTIADPAIARGAIAVGATMRADTTAYFSSRGPGPDLSPKPDLLAPGDEIVSAALGGGRVAMSGTSMAAPHVAGAAALLRQLHPEWTPVEVRAALVGASHDVGRAVYEQGAGRLDAWAAATATLFATPTRLAFGRVLPGGPDTVLTRTLTLHSRAAAGREVTLRVTPEHAVPGVDIAVTPAALTLPAGGEASVTVSVAFHAARPSNRTPPFVAEGLLEIRAGAEVRHVPYAVHDCLELHATLNGSGAFGVVHDRDRVWPSRGFFEPVWLLPPGDYDVMAFGSGIEQPVRITPDLHLAADLELELAGTPADRVLTWVITDESGRSLVRPKMDMAIRHASGASLGFIGFPMPGESRLPEAGPDYRLEWAAYEDDGAVRHDIPGAVDGPFANAAVTNDRSRLRRFTEHFAVTPGDSVLPVEYRLHPDGAGGEFGVALIDPRAPTTTASYDVVQWRAPAPYRGHWRLGRLDWQVHPGPLLGAPGDFIVATGPPLSFDRGDTVGVHHVQLSEPPALAITGNRLSFGDGARVFTAGIAAEMSDFVIAPRPGFSGRLFSDMLGTSTAGRAARWEVMLDDRIVAADTLAGEGSAERVGPFQRQLTLPPGTRGMLIVHAAESNVRGTPSRTTVRAGFGPGMQQTVTPTLGSFAVMAGGSVVDEVRFGQEHAPHVEFTASSPVAREPLVAELFYRVSDAAPWSPLAVSGANGRFTAPLAPADGPVSLRLRIGTRAWGTLEMDVEPAFFAHSSPVLDAPVLQMVADGNGVRVDWRVPAIDGPLVVERSEPEGPWLEWGEVIPLNGVARYEDTGVVPGKRYGYRLAGAEAVAWVQVPVGPPQLALAIAPNPARGELVLALRVDRSAPITLSLLDLQGRVVTSRRLETPVPGVQYVSLVPSGRVPPGLYFVRLERERDVITKRVTLIE
jgi:hypothetical protein